MTAIRRACSEELDLRDGNDHQAADALRAMNQNALDIRGRGRAGHEDAVARVEMRAFAIRVVQIADDPRWIEEDDKVLRENTRDVALLPLASRPDE